MNWKLISISRYSTSCEHCGTSIKNVATIKESETGKTLNIGTTCLHFFLTQPGSLQQAQRMQERMKRAIRQWNSHKELRREGETRDEFINRRIREQGNAVKAFNEYHRRYVGRGKGEMKPVFAWLEQHGYSLMPNHPMYYPPHQHIDGQDGYPRDPNAAHIKCGICHQVRLMEQTQRNIIQFAQKQFLQEFAAELDANPIDFMTSASQVNRI